MASAVAMPPSKFFAFLAESLPGASESRVASRAMFWKKTGAVLTAQNAENILPTATIDNLAGSLRTFLPATQWYCMLHVLAAWATKVSRSPDTLVSPQNRAAFVQACEGVLNALQSNPAERLIYVGEKSLPALALVRVSKVAASYSENAQRAATLLICACAMLQPLGGLDGITLTPLHPVLMKHCIESKLFAEGAAFAQRDVFAVDPDVTPVTSDVAPRYFYLAGVIFIALEKWSNASEMLERCITLPATAVSAVAVAAYKKLVLVSLIEKGAAPTLPVHTADIVARALYPEPLLEDVQAYAAIASAYAARNFEAIVAMHDPVLRSDGNVQLMVQCVSSVPAFKVKRLTRAYVTLPLAVVAEKVGLATARDAERLILQLAFEGALVAQIDAVSGDVAFEEAEGASGSSSDASKLEGGIGIAALHAQLQRTMELAQQLQKIDEEITTSDAHVRATSMGGLGAFGSDGGRARPELDGGMGAGESVASMDFDPPGGTW